MRPSLDDTLMTVAFTWSRRSTCSRLQVGAILVRDGRPFAQGYNGSARGEAECLHEVDEKCQDSVHAETNVLINAAKDGYATKGSTMYVTHSPCYPCAASIINSEIAEVVYARDYRLTGGLDRLRAAGITVRCLRGFSFPES